MTQVMMRMGKRGDDPIPDDWLVRDGVRDLHRNLRISPRQAHRLTGL